VSAVESIDQSTVDLAWVLVGRVSRRRLADRVVSTGGNARVGVRRLGARHPVRCLLNLPTAA
jgi:hypothetical protein